MTKFMNFLDEKLKEQRGMTLRSITYGFEKHHKVIEWLKANANISYNLNETHDYEPSKKYKKGSVTIEVDMDEATFNKLQKFINGQVADKSNKGMPPA